LGRILSPGFKNGNALITGGAGFIGSHLAYKLLNSTNDQTVTVFDNLSTGKISNLSAIRNVERFRFVNQDMAHPEYLTDPLKEVEVVFHMAAFPDVRSGFASPELPYNENVRNTFYLLEKIRKSGVKQIVFSSSSTVYGEPVTIPTPEDYGMLLPISPYGASKLACEALISSYSYTYGIQSVIFRLANVIGARSTHGVIWDLIKKLKSDSSKLEILGDGSQTKSYIHIGDCIDSFLFTLSRLDKKIDVFNVGNVDTTDVMSIAREVCTAMELNNVGIQTFSIDNSGRGWKGDVKNMQLDIRKLQKLGWKPKLSSAEAVRLSCKELLDTWNFGA
jgi:UDP-glucose 4-epimerase